MNTPAFIITIDTEGDNIWKNHNQVLTKNASFLPRFQELCEKYSFKVVYLTNYEMATNKTFIEFARAAILRGNAEIGMHLHAWNSPPSYALTHNDKYHKPYLIEYPTEIIKKKILFMTQLLEDTFQKKILSHRAGRWAFNEHYAAVLLKLGYQVDCSVTPRINWNFSPGSPEGEGGSNYRDFPDYAYFIDPNNISCPGSSRLLEVPMTTSYKHLPWVNVVIRFYDLLRGKQRNLSVQLLRPENINIEKIYKLIVKKYLKKARSDYLEFMLHSSELMPGGSPTFRDKTAIERLYYNLEMLFIYLKNKVIGMTLTQYYHHYLKNQKNRY